jgi:nucleoid-associated protein YgaU
MRAHPRKIIVRATTGVTALLVCVAFMSAILSCKSGPDEATQGALKDAQDKTERAREQAMDFGGGVYAADEWNAAETLYTAAKDLPLVTMKDYQAAIPQFDDIFNNYMDVFYKAAPQYVEARKSLIASKRQDAVDAGAKTYLAQELDAVDEQDKNSLTLYTNSDYYGYQAASFEVEKRYELLQTEATAISLKDEIVANKFDRFDPDALVAADESFTAAKTAYAANDLDAAQSAANDALAKYRQVLSNGWKSYAGEQQPLAEAARADAVAIHADIALKDDFDAADAAYNQGVDDYSAESYQAAADAFVKVQPMFAALVKTAGAQQKNAVTALQTAQKVVVASQKKAAAFPETANNEFLTKADELLASAQSSLDAGDYAGAVASAAEAQKNAGLSDSYVSQQQKMKAANEALAAAKKQMDGVTPDAQKKYAPLYNTATAAYSDALSAQRAKDWDAVAADAKKITAAVAAIAKAKAADDAAEKKAADAAGAALAAAKRRLDGVGAEARKEYAGQYGTASSAYSDAAKAQNAKDWDAVTANVKRVNDALDQLDKAAAAALAAAEARRKAEEAALAAAEVRRKAEEAALAAEKQQADAATAALAAAKDRLDWAAAIGAADQYPDPYGQAEAAYNDGEAALAAQDWDQASADARTVVALVDGIEDQKSGEAVDAMSIAKERLDWAEGVNAEEDYPDNFAQATSSYADGVDALEEKDWNAAILAADGVMSALASISVQPRPSPLPAQYTVKSWESTRDCLWNIAAYPWVYNDPFQWRRLYEANRDKLPNPNNSDRIEIGTVIDIPSIFGEVREGLWEEGKVYEPLLRE